MKDCSPRWKVLLIGGNSGAGKTVIVEFAAELPYRENAQVTERQFCGTIGPWIER